MEASMRRAHRFVGALLPLFVAACGSDEAAPPGASPSPPPEPATVDFGAVIRQVEQAYRPAADGFGAALPTYEVKVAPGGKVRFTPFRFDGGQRVAGAPLELETASAALSAAPSVEKDGSLALGRAAAIERLKNGDDGAEQSWSFPTRPPGDGDLVVRVRVSGLDYAGETAGGQHFVDPATRLGVRYGHGTWVDARGRRSPIPARYEDGALVLRVPGSLVSASMFPAALDPVVGPEFGPDRPIVAPDPVREGAAMACTRVQCLLAWPEFRNARAEIVAARVDAGGDVLDPGGIEVSIPPNARFNDRSVGVATDGTDFLVGWLRTSPGENDVRAARVTELGETPDAPDGREIARFTSSGLNPPARVQGLAVAFGAGEYLVAWSDARDGEISVFGRLLDLDADPIGDELPLAGAGPNIIVKAGTFNGDHFVLSGTDDSFGGLDLFVLRVSTAGRQIRYDTLPHDASNEDEPALASDGRDSLLVYSLGGGAIFGVLVGRSTIGDRFLVDATVGGNHTPAVAFDGDRYLEMGQAVAQGGVTIIRGRFVDRRGALLGPVFDVARGPNAVAEPAVGALDTEFLVGWTTTPPGGATTLLASRVSRTGVVRDPGGFPVSTSVANEQVEPAVGFDGTNYLVVWADDRGGLQFQILGARVSPSGALLDPAGITVADSPSDKHAPALAWCGYEFLVVWDAIHDATATDVEGVRVEPTGAVEGDVVEISADPGDQQLPRVVWDGATFFVVFEDWQNGTSSNVGGVRVAEDGTVLDVPPILVAAVPDDQTAPDVAFDGTNLHVVFEDWRAGEAFAPDVYEVRLQPGGLILDGRPTVVAAAPGRQGAPRAAPDGRGDVFVVWEDGRAGDLDVRGARVDPDGGVLDPAGVDVAAGPGDQTQPALDLQGSRFLVAWTDTPADGHADVRAVRLSNRRLTPLGDPFVIAAAADPEYAPALAFGPPGAALVAYEAYVGAWDRRRVRARLVTGL
jgi:hypothetical protein